MLYSYILDHGGQGSSNFRQTRQRYVPPLGIHKAQHGFCPGRRTFSLPLLFNLPLQCTGTLTRVVYIPQELDTYQPEIRSANQSPHDLFHPALVQLQAQMRLYEVSYLCVRT